MAECVESGINPVSRGKPQSAGCSLFVRLNGAVRAVWPAVALPLLLSAHGFPLVCVLKNKQNSNQQTQLLVPFVSPAGVGVRSVARACVVAAAEEDSPH